jgi:quercetin dioxygenase-like cupin family protein
LKRRSLLKEYKMVTTHDGAIQAQPELRNSTWYGESLATTLVPGEATGGRYALVHMRSQRSYSPPPHRHGFEAFYVIRGAMRFDVGGELLLATAGSFVEVPAGAWHTFWVDSDEVEYLIFTAPSWGIERFFGAIGSPAAELELPEGRVGPLEIPRLQQAAVKYGIELAPPGTTPRELTERG